LACQGLYRYCFIFDTNKRLSSNGYWLKKLN